MDRHILETAFDDLCQRAFDARRFSGRSEDPVLDNAVDVLMYTAHSTLMRPTLLSEDPDYIIVANSIHIDIVDHLEINAFASRFENHHFVGVFKGTCLRLLGTFLALACHPRILPLVGNVRKLQPFARIRGTADGRGRSWIEVSNNNTDWTIPRVDLLDDDRLAMASACYAYAICFLLRHELGHIVRGHLQHLRSANSHPMLLESAAASGSAESRLTRSAIEYDADKWSAVETIHYLSVCSGEDWRTKLDIFALAAATLFTLFDEARAPIEPNDSYPHPSIRYLLVLSQAARVCAEVNAKPLNEVLASVRTFDMQTLLLLGSLLSGHRHGVMTEATTSGMFERQLHLIVDKLTQLESEFDVAVNRLAAEL